MSFMELFIPWKSLTNEKNPSRGISSEGDLLMFDDGMYRYWCSNGVGDPWPHTVTMEKNTKKGWVVFEIYDGDSPTDQMGLAARNDE